jgi:hypothetical protein
MMTTRGATVKATWILAASLLAAGVPAFAQAPVPEPAAGSSRDDISRDDIKMMEGVLTNAVRNGAETLARQMQFNEPGSIIVTGTARARGYVLDGYGFFFVVDVPMMKQSDVWSRQVLLREQERELLRRIVANNPDPAARREAEARLRSLERRDVPAAAGLAPVAQPAPGMAAAQTVPETVTPAAANAAASAPAAADARDPNERYTEAVKNALIDAMLKYSAALKVGPEEWLTVAAQDSEGPLTPGEVYDASTLVVRVKGSDLSAFQANRITRDEVLKKVEVREF